MIDRKSQKELDKIVARNQYRLKGYLSEVDTNAEDREKLDDARKKLRENSAKYGKNIKYNEMVAKKIDKTLEQEELHQKEYKEDEKKTSDYSKALDYEIEKAIKKGKIKPPKK